MDLVLRVPKDKYRKVRDLLLKDDTVSRASVNFREAKTLEFAGDDYLCIVQGLDGAVARAREIAQGCPAAEPKERDLVLSKLKGESEAAAAGFGSIFE
ncbi:MAG: hypothetical protein HY558_01270 [Euryarchaeota archaeon]|nr:hypothetical protein [Euryarchaeota archaeon]